MQFKQTQTHAYAHVRTSRAHTPISTYTHVHMQATHIHACTQIGAHT